MKGVSDDGLYIEGPLRIESMLRLTVASGLYVTQDGGDETRSNDTRCSSASARVNLLSRPTRTTVTERLKDT